MYLIKHLSLLLMLLLLNGCAAIGLLYDAAPRLAQYELDSYINLSSAQEQALEPQINQAFAWHRKTQLPVYSAWLKAQADNATKPLTTAQVAQSANTALGFARDIGQHLLPQQAELALSLTPKNLKSLQSKLDKDNRKYEKEHPLNDPDAAKAKRFEDTLKWLERVYGDFDAAQTKQLRAASDSRPLNTALELKIRRARQAELLSTLNNIATNKPPQAQAQQQLVELVQRLDSLSAKLEAEQAIQISGRESMVAFIVQASNIASAEQREGAKQRLLRWAADADKLHRAAR